MVALGLAIYLIGNQSRLGLAHSNSSFFSNNLSEKIFFLIASFTLATISIMALPFIIEKLSKYLDLSVKSHKLLIYLPNITFSIVVALPVLIQRYSNNHLVSIFYKIIRVGNSYPNFLDLRQTIHYIGDPRVHKIGDMGYVYPGILLKLRFCMQFISHPSRQTIFGLLLIILLNLVIWDFSRSLLTRSKILFSLLLITPPMHLLLDRMNIDLIILILLYLGTKKITEKNFFWNSSSYFIITLTVYLKFYTFPLFLLFFLFKKSLRERLIIIAFALLAAMPVIRDAGLLVKFQIRDLSGTFGLSTLLAHYAGSPISGFFILTYGALFILIFVVFLIPNKINELYNENRVINRPDFYVFSLIFLSTFVLSNNYMYRLYPLIFIIPILSNRSKYPIDSKSALAIISTFFGVRTTGILMNLLLLPMVVELAAELLNFSYFELFKRRSSRKSGSDHSIK